MANHWDSIFSKALVWVLIDKLLFGVVNSNGINSSGSTLHLHLWPVDTRFIVKKKSGEMFSRVCPM